MAKLFVIHARDAAIAVIIRRGPSAWHHLIKWDTRRDLFQHGAWFKGRIYEDRCDLSPDGSLFLQFVHKGSQNDVSVTHAWTAVSRMPWLHALVLWPHGCTWGGGGRFIDNRTVCLRGSPYGTHWRFPLRGIRVVAQDAPLHQKTDDVQDADWCGRDFENRIIFSRAGQLFRRRNSVDSLVADFTDLRPNPEPAPDWATREI